jgi:hypothetical protein
MKLQKRIRLQPACGHGVCQLHRQCVRTRPSALSVTSREQGAPGLAASGSKARLCRSVHCRVPDGVTREPRQWQLATSACASRILSLSLLPVCLVPLPKQREQNPSVDCYRQSRRRSWPWLRPGTTLTWQAAPRQANLPPHLHGADATMQRASTHCAPYNVPYC